MLSIFFLEATCFSFVYEVSFLTLGDLRHGISSSCLPCRFVYCQARKFDMHHKGYTGEKSCYSFTLIRLYVWFKPYRKTDLNFSIKNNRYSTENIAFYTVASACPLPNKFHKGLLLSSRTSLTVYFIYPLLINGSEILAFLINELALNIINSSTTTLSTRFVKMYSKETSTRKWMNYIRL